MNRKLIFLSATFAALTASALAAPVLAASTADVPSLSVRYTAAELGNPEGARRLYERIVSSADALCASTDGASLDRKAQFARCRRATIDRAVAALDAPRVTALHEGRTEASVAFAHR